jgi:hypothetical protein
LLLGRKYAEEVFHGSCEQVLIQSDGRPREGGGGHLLSDYDCILNPNEPE